MRNLLTAALALGALASPALAHDLTVLESEDGQSFSMVSDGERVAAIATAPDGSSVLLFDQDATAALQISEAALGFDALVQPARPAVNLLGLVKVYEDDAADAAHVEVKFGGRAVHVQALEGADEAAHVSITGASRRDARRFINKIDAAPADLIAAMKAHLGLDT